MGVLVAVRRHLIVAVFEDLRALRRKDGVEHDGDRAAHGVLDADGKIDAA